MPNPPPVFHPVTMIPTVLKITDDSVVEAKEQLARIKIVKERPHILDDDLVERSLKLYKEQNDDSAYFLQQCSFWRKEKLSELQLAQVQEIENCTHLLTDINNQLIAIFEYCKNYTIDKILAKDDLELALDFLAGKTPLFKGKL
jgi:hypothetical protein